MASAMIGGIAVARATAKACPELSDEILMGVRRVLGELGGAMPGAARSPAAARQPVATPQPVTPPIHVTPVAKRRRRPRKTRQRRG